MRTLETDYLVVGAGAAGMAFTDSLVTHSDADVIMVDRRDRPGGHWNDAYSFVRLHHPSAYYGVNSRPLGADTVDTHGPNAGLYERATGAQICDYYGHVLEDLLLSGRVRFLGGSDYQSTPSGEHRVVSRVTGEATDVTVRRKLVDATYLESAVPATHSPSFQVHGSARVIPVGELVGVTEAPSTYVVIGAGKTAMDACVWLLDNGVRPERIRWIKPREAWLLNREGWQPLDQVGSVVEGFSLEFEALAAATSVDDLFARLERCGRLVRIDEQVAPTMFRCATVSRPELAQLRQIRDVVRLGRVLRIDADRIVLEEGSLPTDADHLYVDCTANGIRVAPAVPIFTDHRITVQQVRNCSPTFNAALLGYIESTRADLAEQNRLCPPNPLPSAARDWLSNIAISMAAARRWQAEPDLTEWVESSRLNVLRGAHLPTDDPRMTQAAQRSAEHIKPALTRLHELMT